MTFHSIILLVAIAVAVTIFAPAAVRAETTGSDKNLVVGVVGLGQMGQSIVQCYNQHGYQVHAWNRGEARRQQVQDLGLKNVQVHDELEQVLASTDLVIMAIMGGVDLRNAQELIQSIPAKFWKGKTLMQYSAHEPLSAKNHEKLLHSLGANLIAGAMMAEPQDVCGEGRFFVASTNSAKLEEFVPTLAKMGTVIKFEDDVGLASLADIGLLQSIYFGMSGLEMAFLLMERYGAPASFQEGFHGLATEVVTAFFPSFSRHVAHVITTKKWTETVDTKEVGMDVFEVWLAFLKKMGVADDTFLHSFYKYLQLVPNDKDAMSRWIEFAVVKPIAQEL